jgi:dolichol-phosphate mannosyltransferase|tara:strand:+ start:850 stop:1620 length:771 start_codon:yes stop_codon:yes gene_type:complete
MSKINSLIIIPTYNESDNIIDLINEIFLLDEDFHILVVDDNSLDKTASLVDEKIKTSSDKLFILKRKSKLGLGSAYSDGYKWALSKISTNNGIEYDKKCIYDSVYTMDADFSHNPRDLLRMKVFLTENGMDLVIGSRYKTGVNVVNWPIQRVLLSYFGSWYARFITRVPIMDLTSGFVGYKINVIKDIMSKGIEFNGYAYQIEMKFKAYVLNYKLYEIPIIFTDRTKGESKMNKSIIPEAVFGLLKMKLKHIFSRL